ncbi:MAG: type IV pilus twitching motility protein PilT [Helicobacteraceae bacterium]|jgi:twitching motility protein PilT|nr:type IV pilus twitching motility protein PilT [Helicobacteraceae bacterium]
MDFTLEQLLNTIAAHNASDLHLIAGSEPQIRIYGKLKPLDLPRMDKNDIQTLCYSVITESQKKRLEETKELDFALDIPKVGRYRTNYYYQRHGLAAAFRIIPTEIPTMESLGLPKVLHEVIRRQRGLILVTGPTGSGKTTTMAAIIDEINRTENGHIVTIEDPVEFIHEHRGCLMSHRSLGEDTKSFASALKHSMRQDPDVIFVGEMRDVETIRTAMTAAETGHLVFGTLHTNSAPQTISRIVNVFPTDEQELVRTQLSMGLLCGVSQCLIPRANGDGRKAIFEILINTPAVANLIRDNKLHQIMATMQLGQGQTHMQTQTQEILKAVRDREIAGEEALKYSSSIEELKKALGVGAEQEQQLKR